jgi:hypothetical protein
MALWYCYLSHRYRDGYRQQEYNEQDNQGALAYHPTPPAGRMRSLYIAS